MSKVLDQRIVEMRLENKDFESNAKQSISTLQKLKNALSFKNNNYQAIDKLSTGLRSIEAPAKVAISSISKMATVTDQLTRSLTGVSFDAIVSGLKSLYDPIRNIINPLQGAASGFTEYELKMNSIQTIMSNTRDKGTTMDEVTQTLNELNTYADKTIYNFAEMTRNIGTFTAAGIDLDTSAKAIQGIANLAAMSGSTSQQASTAMYQLSQALAAGTVKLMDWNSVVNAGMGGQLFQNALKETAREMGTDVDALIEDNGSFRESLQEGWITSDVLSTTLSKQTVEGATAYAQQMLEAGKYTQEQADALIASAKAAEDAATKVKTLTQLIDTLNEAVGSGWAQSWEYLFGNFDEAKAEFTQLSDFLSGLINDSSNKRNAFLEQLLYGTGGDNKWKEFKQNLSDAGVSYDTFIEKAEEAARNAGFDIDTLIEQTGSFEASLSGGWLGDAANSIVNISDVLGQLTGTAEGVNGSLETYQQLVSEIWQGQWGNGTERVQALLDAGYTEEQVQAIQELVDKGSEYQIQQEDLSDVLQTNAELTNEQKENVSSLADAWNTAMGDANKKTGRELVLDSVYNALVSINNVIEAVKTGFSNAFDLPDADELYSIFERIDSFTAGLASNEGLYHDIMIIATGFFSIFKVGATIIGAFWDAISPILFSGAESGGGTLLDFLVRLAQQITLFSSNLEKRKGDITGFFTGILNTIMPIINVITGVIGTFFNWATDLLDPTSHTIQGGDIFAPLLSSLRDVTGFDFPGVVNSISSVFGIARDKASEISNSIFGDFPEDTSIFDVIKAKIVEFVDFIQSKFPQLNNVKDGISGLISSFKSAVVSKVSDIDGLSVLDSIKEKFSSFVATIKGLLPDASSIADNLPDFGSIKDKIPDLGSIKDKISAFIGSIKELLPDISSVGDTLPTLDDIKNKFSSFITTLKELLPDVSSITDKLPDVSSIANAISGFFSSVTSGITSFFSGIGNDVSDAGNSVFTSISDVFDGIKESLGNGFTAIANWWMTSPVAGLIKSIIAGIISLITFKKVKHAIEDSALFRLFKAFSNGAATFNNIVDGLTTIKETVESVKTTLKSFRHEIRATAILEIAVAVGILAAAMWVVAQIPADRLDASAKTIAELLLAVVIMSNLIGDNVFTTAGTAVTAAELIAIGQALILLAAGLKIISTIDPDRIDQAALALESMMLILALAVQLSNMGQPSFFGGIGNSSQFMAIATAMVIMAGALKLIASISQEDLDKAVPVITAFGLILGAVNALSNVTGGEFSGFANAASYIAFASSLYIFAGAIVKLAEIDQADLDKALITIGILGGIVAGVNFVSGLSVHLPGKFSISTYVQWQNYISIAGSLYVLGEAVAKLGALDPSTIRRGLITIGILAAGLTVFLLLSRLISKIKIADAGDGKKSAGNSFFGSMGTIIGLAAGVFLIGEAIVRLGGLDQNELIKGGIAAGVIAAALVILTGITSLFKGASLDQAATIAAIAAAVFVVALAIEQLGALDDDTIKTGLIALGGAFVVLAFGILAVGAAAKTLSGVSVPLLLFAAAIALIVGSIALVIQALASFTAALTALMSETSDGEDINAVTDNMVTFITSVVDGLKERIPELVDSFGSFFSTLFSEVAASMGEFDTTNFDFIDGFIDGLKQVLDKTGDLGGSAFKATIAIRLVKHFLDVLSSIASDTTISDEQLGQIQHFGEAIGTFLGAIVGKTVTDFASAVNEATLPEGGIDGTKFQSALTIARQLNDFYNELPDVGGLVGFVNGVKDFNGFGEAMGGVDPETGEDIKEGFTGLGTVLTNFVTAINESSIPTKTTSVQWKKIQNAIELAGQLNDFYTALPDAGGLKEVINGYKDYVGYAEAIGGKADTKNSDGTTLIEGFNGLGTVLTDFTTAINESNIPSDATSVEWNKLQNAIDIATKLNELYGNLPNVGGLYDMIFGTTDSAGFAKFIGGSTGTKDKNGNTVIEGFKGLGTVLNDFVTAINGTAIPTEGPDLTKIDTAIDIAEKLNDFYKKLPDTGGLWGWLAGSTDFVGFSEAIGGTTDENGNTVLAGLGQALSAFVTAINGSDFPSEGIDGTKIKTAIDVATGLEGIYEALPNIGGVAGWLVGDQNLGDFASGVGELGTGLANFANAVAGSSITSDEVDAAVSAAKGLAAVQKVLTYTDYSSKNWTNFADNINTFTTKLKDIDFTGIDGEGIDEVSTVAKKFAGIMVELGSTDMGQAKANSESIKDTAGELASAYLKLTYDVKLNNLAAVNVLSSSASSFIGIFEDVNDFDAGATLDNAESMKSAAGELASAYLKLTLDSNFTDTDTITTVCTNIGSLAQAISDAASQSFGDASALSDAAAQVSAWDSEAIKNKVAEGDKSYKSAGNDLAAKIAGGAVENKASVEDAGTSISIAFLDGMATLQDIIVGAGSGLVEWVSNGIRSNEAARTAAIVVATNIKNAFNDLPGELYTVGEYSMSGLAAGISNNASTAINAAVSAATSTYAAAKSALDIASPSKKFAELGRWSDLGFAEGFTKNSQVVYDAAYSTAYESVNGANAALSALDLMMSDDDFDYQPTISPVVDLTNVQAASGQMRSMMGLDTSMLNAQVSYVGSQMSARQNGSADIVRAINKFSDRIDPSKLGSTNNYLDGIQIGRDTDIYDAASTFANVLIEELRR